MMVSQYTQRALATLEPSVDWIRGFAPNTPNGIIKDEK
jgi:hypothetical protein